MVLSMVERGWQAARECSLDLQRQGIGVIHLLKGRLSRSVRSLIEPRPHVRVISVPHPVFWPVVWVICIGLIVTGRVKSLLVDNERSYRRLAWWARRARLNVTMIRQGSQGYEFWMEARRVPRAVWWTEVLGQACVSP